MPGFDPTLDGQGAEHWDFRLETDDHRVWTVAVPSGERWVGTLEELAPRFKLWVNDPLNSGYLTRT